MTQQRVSPISVTSVLPAVPVLSLQAALGQSANIQEWKNSSGSTIAYLDASGNFILNAATNQTLGWNLSNFQRNATTGFVTLVLQNFSGAGFGITAGNAGANPLIVKGAASQTADLQQWQNSAGTVLARIASNGDFLSTVTIGAPYFSDGTATRPYIDFTVANKMIAQARNAAYVAWTVRGAASQTANLQEWQNSAGTVLVNIDPPNTLAGGVGAFLRFTDAGVGGIKWGNRTVFGLGEVSLTTAILNAYDANYKGLVIRGAASQTANLQEWQNSAGTVLASITSNGYLAVGGATTGSFTSIVTVRAGGSSQVGVAIGTEAGTSSDALRIFNATGGTTLTTIKNNGEITAPLATFTANSVSVVPITSKGAASQTANLQEWQNSTGTILARVNSDGIIISGTIQTTSALAQLSEENSGGRFRLTKATATGSNPGTDVAKIYLRDGTNAGTLKLVVRAGTAGAETTILDNIPQT